MFRDEHTARKDGSSISDKSNLLPIPYLTIPVHSADFIFEIYIVHPFWWFST